MAAPENTVGQRDYQLQFKIKYKFSNNNTSHIFMTMGGACMVIEKFSEIFSVLITFLVGIFGIFLNFRYYDAYDAAGYQIVPLTH